MRNRVADAGIDRLRLLLRQLKGDLAGLRGTLAIGFGLLACALLFRLGRLLRAPPFCLSLQFEELLLLLHFDAGELLVSAEGDVKLVDFGIARQLTAEGGEAERTATGLRLLSLNYAAPEQIRGERLDVRADVHALGVILTNCWRAGRRWT